MMKSLENEESEEFKITLLLIVCMCLVLLFTIYRCLLHLFLLIKKYLFNSTQALSDFI